VVGGSRPSGRVVILTGGGAREKVAGFLGRARGESVVVAIARLMSAVCLLLVAVISARHLGPAGRGEIVFVLTVSMLGSEFVSLGANVSGRIQILRRSGVAVEDYLGLSVVLAFAQAALMALVFGTVGILVMDLSPMVCILGTLLGIAMFLAYMLVDAAFALRRTLETGVRDLLIGITPLAPVIAVAAVGRLSVAAVVGLTGLGYLIGGGYLWSVVYRRIGAVRFSRGAWGPILRNGLPVLGGSFGQTLAFRADRLILGVLAVVCSQAAGWLRSWIGIGVVALLFAVSMLNFSSPRSLGVQSQSIARQGPLSTRADLAVNMRDLEDYGRLIDLLERETSPGETIYAAPDCPEVYFLAKRRNATRTMYDLFDTREDREQRILEMLDEHKVQAVVVNMLPEFSRPLSAGFLAELKQKFPQRASIGIVQRGPISPPTGRFRVYWR